MDDDSAQLDYQPGTGFVVKLVLGTDALPFLNALLHAVEAGEMEMFAQPPDIQAKLAHCGNLRLFLEPLAAFSQREFVRSLPAGLNEDVLRKKTDAWYGRQLAIVRGRKVRANPPLWEQVALLLRQCALHYAEHVQEKGSVKQKNAAVERLVSEIENAYQFFDEDDYQERTKK